MDVQNDSESIGVWQNLAIILVLDHLVANGARMEMPTTARNKLPVWFASCNLLAQTESDCLARANSEIQSRLATKNSPAIPLLPAFSSSRVLNCLK